MSARKVAERDARAGGKAHGIYAEISNEINYENILRHAQLLLKYDWYVVWRVCFYEIPSETRERFDVGWRAPNPKISLDSTNRTV